MDVVTGRYDTCTIQQRGADLRDTLVGNRRHCDDGLTALRERCTIDEVHLATYARPELRTERVGANLTRQIDLQGRVDGRYTVVLGNHIGVVRVTHVHHQHARVVVDEVIHLLRTHQEGRNHLTLVDILGLTVDNALLYERQHAVGEHLGVDTQVLVVAQLGQYGVGNGTDTHLQRSTILNQGGTVLTNGGLHLVGSREVSLHQRRIVLAPDVDLLHRNHRLTKGTGNILVHYGNHIVGALHSGQRSINRRTKRYIAVLIGGRYLNHSHIAGNGTATIQTLRLAQEDGNVIGVARLGYLAHVTTHEERIQLEDALELRIGIGSRTLGVEVMDVYIFQLATLTTSAHSLNQTLRSRCYGAQVYVVTRLNDLNGLLGRSKMNRCQHFDSKFYDG